MYTCIRTFQISQLVMVLCSTIVQLSKQKRTKISRHSRRISVLAFGLCLTHFTWKFFKQCICMLSFCHNCFPILTKCQHSLTFYIHRGDFIYIFSLSCSPKFQSSTFTSKTKQERTIRQAFGSRFLPRQWLVWQL